MASQKLSVAVSIFNFYFGCYACYIIKLRPQVRKFSTNPSLSQMVKPPVQIFGIEGRYATALYSAASKQKTLDGVEKDLMKFQASLKSDAKLKEFVQDPTIKHNFKGNAKLVALKISIKSVARNLI